MLVKVFWWGNSKSDNDAIDAWDDISFIGIFIFYSVFYNIKYIQLFFFQKIEKSFEIILMQIFEKFTNNIFYLKIEMFIF